MSTRFSNGTPARKPHTGTRFARPDARGQLGRLPDELYRELQALTVNQVRLETSLDRYTRLYDFAPVGYMTLGESGAIREINATGRHFLGQPRTRRRGLPLSGFIAKPDRRKFRNHLRLCRERGDRVSTELRLARKRGESVVWLELISIATPRERNGRREYRCAFMDVTERKQSEQARQESETRFRNLADSVPALIWICDADKRCIYFNRRWLEFDGRPRKEQMAGGWAAGIHPDDRSRCWKVYKAFSGARVEFKIEYRRRRFDGEYHWVLDNAMPLFSPANEFRGYIGSCIDITNHKRMEEALAEAHDKMEDRVRQRTMELARTNASLLAEIEKHRQTEVALRESEERLADFFEQSPLALLWVGSGGHVQRVNQAWVELAGCPRTDCLQCRLQEFFADAPTAAGLLRRLKCHDTIYNHRVRLRRGDGAIRHCLVDADGLWENNRLIHSRWFFRDITRQVELEREILLVTEREQRRIGRDLHDDLCQQLTGIEFLSQSLARGLSKRAPTGASRAREIAGMVRMAITHTRELAHGLSPVQLEAGSLPDALRTLSARARKLFGLECRFHCTEPFLNRDDVLAVHLYRIAQEALANAVKHGGAKRVDLRLVQTKRQMALSVTDDGVGLPANISSGKGMGLHVMQYRAHVLGGMLRVRRARRGGTVVECTVKGDNGKTNLKRSA